MLVVYPGTLLEGFVYSGLYVFNKLMHMRHSPMSLTFLIGCCGYKGYEVC
jgi:hypothetical protein